MTVTLSPNFMASDAAGFVESDADWALRTQIPDDWAQRLALAWCWSLIVDAAYVAELEARIAAERSLPDRAVTFVASGLTGRHLLAALATTAALLLLGHRLTHWGTNVR